MTATEEFAKRLKQLRFNKGVSLKKAAETLGVTAQSLSLYENGMRTINIDLLKKVAQYFGEIGRASCRERVSFGV